MTADTLILLVNDIPDHVANYETALLRHGFKVQVARTGEQALVLAQHSMPQCAVIDLRLPDMSGWDLCSRLKASGNARTRVIVLTPDVSRTCAEDSVKIGCHAWLAHPTVPDDLARTVRQVLELDTDVPSSMDAALIGLMSCPGCESDKVRAQLRVGAAQYFCCKACGFCWRMEVLATHS